MAIVNYMAYFHSVPRQGIGIDFFCRVGKKYPIALVPIILFYIGAIEYLSGSVVWLILMWPLILYLLILLALNFSLRRMTVDDRVGVDIYFVDNARPPLKNVMVLKINDEIVRVRDGERSILINKDEVFKMELKLPDKYLPEKELTPPTIHLSN